MLRRSVFASYGCEGQGINAQYPSKQRRSPPRSGREIFVAKKELEGSNPVLNLIRPVPSFGGAVSPLQDWEPLLQSG